MKKSIYVANFQRTQNHKPRLTNSDYDSFFFSYVFVYCTELCTAGAVDDGSNKVHWFRVWETAVRMVMSLNKNLEYGDNLWLFNSLSKNGYVSSIPSFFFIYFFFPSFMTDKIRRKVEHWGKLFKEGKEASGLRRERDVKTQERKREAFSTWQK